MKNKNLLKKLTWLIQDFSLLMMIKISGKLSWHLNQKLGACLGTIAFWLAPNRRRVVTANLNACFPEFSVEKRTQLARANFREYGKLYFELGYIWQTDAAYLHTLIKQVDNLELAVQASATGGVVYALLHQGCWELCGIPLAKTIRRYTLYKPNRRMPKSDYLINQGRRQALNCTVLPATSHSIRHLARALKTGGSVFILGDIVPGGTSGAVMAPFFGTAARTSTLICRLAQRAPVIFVSATRLDNGYHISYLAAPHALYDKDPQVSAQALNQMFEQMICRCPEQYLWAYKRFYRSPSESIYD